MIKILTLALLPLFSFAQRDEPCNYPTLNDIVMCGSETQSSIVVGGLQSNGDITISSVSGGGIDFFSNGNFQCRDGSNRVCINVIAGDGTISMRNTTVTNAEVELKYAGTTTTTAVFTYRNQIDTVAYVTDIPRIIGIAPVFTNDSTAGVGGLTSGKIYKSLVGTDYVLKIKQ